MYNRHTRSIEAPTTIACSLGKMPGTLTLIRTGMEFSPEAKDAETIRWTSADMTNLENCWDDAGNTCLRVNKTDVLAFEKWGTYFDVLTHCRFWRLRHWEREAARTKREWGDEKDGKRVRLAEMYAKEACEAAEVAIQRREAAEKRLAELLAIPGMQEAAERDKELEKAKSSAEKAMRQAYYCDE